MTCFMFPGQPLSAPATLPDDTEFGEICALARTHAHFDLETFTWTKAVAASDNAKLQVLGVALSLYRLRQLRKEGIAARCAAEHSLGIYPALAACGCIADSDALEMAFRAGVCMSAMAARRQYALACIVGLTIEPLLAIAENTGIFLANQNTSRHFLLSGERHNVEHAEAEALEAGAFSVKLFPCDAPLHTPLMAEIAGELNDVFKGYRYREPEIPIINHIDQDHLAAADLPGFLARELEAPVYWERTYLKLRSAGAGRFIEVGIGDSLKKHNLWVENELGR